MVFVPIPVLQCRRLQPLGILYECHRATSLPVCRHGVRGYPQLTSELCLWHLPTLRVCR
jgi:hypothetical protein